MSGCYKYIVCLAVCLSCSEEVRVSETLECKPRIVPDYEDVTVPANIAPLNFSLKDTVCDARAVLTYADYRVEARAKNGRFVFPVSEWKRLLQSAKGGAVDVAVCVKKEGRWISYAPFRWTVAEEPVDAYVVYRLIPPGYTLWNKMGIYQRNVENYAETPIIENKMSGRNCVNCHSFCMQDPDKMLFHMREKFPGTIIVDGGRIEKLNTKTKQTISSLVYPAWHPSGRYVAFSVNNTKQGFHMNDRNRIEVFDEASDVVVYDVSKHEVFTASALFSKDAFETFPAFSPDGKTLYFCTAAARPIPEEYSEIKYSLCSVGFDPDTRAFGAVDTLYNASERGGSVSFPRVSPDGRHLMFTLSGYGNFSIWHKDADLYMMDLASMECSPMEALNSDDVESYHSWSSNSRWVVFSSRRIDGLYTRLYVVYIDKDGRAGKPFLLPQKDAGFYDGFMMSYNIPEFVKGEVKVRGRALGLKAKTDKGINVRFK